MRARSRRLRIVAVSGLLLIAAGILAFMALRQSANLFYTPTQLAERGGPEPGLSGKIGGFVEIGSLVYSEGTRFVFRVVDESNSIDVAYDGIPPALFQEGSGVVAEGSFNQEGQFIATRLLAKHDENYVPRELADIEGPQT